MTTGQQARIVLIVGMMLMSAVAASTRMESQPSTQPRDAPSVFDGVVGNVAGSPELSTAKLHASLASTSAIVLDARPYEEYAVSHIPGARAVPAKPGTTPALYVGDAAEVGKSIPDKTQPCIATVSFAAVASGLRMTNNVTFFGGAITDLPELLDDEER